MATSISSDPFLAAALGLAALSVLVLVWYLVRRPALTRGTKLVLLLGIGLFPLGTAATGNVAGYHATKTRHFCASSCHVMVPYGADSDDKTSTSLAARHARNESFGDENCYTCHADYGMFGTITTKIGGMRHVYEYLLHYRDTTLVDFLREVEIRRPFQNDTCMRCHSTRNPSWNQVADHTSALVELRTGRTSCASEGCHGPAHPFSKRTKATAGGTR